MTGGCQNPVEIVEFKNTTWDILRSISENMDKLFRPVGEHYGLTMMQVRILLEIGNRTRTVGSLGKSISVAGGNISAMCKKLEKEGFVMRSRDSADEAHRQCDSQRERKENDQNDRKRFAEIIRGEPGAGGPGGFAEYDHGFGEI
ncbi:MAG: MarR family winged helix-turn-helix transcriptional regulator [Clostridia bacterium]